MGVIVSVFVWVGNYGLVYMCVVCE